MILLTPILVWNKVIFCVCVYVCAWYVQHIDAYKHALYAPPKKKNRRKREVTSCCSLPSRNTAASMQQARRQRGKGGDGGIRAWRGGGGRNKKKTWGGGQHARKRKRRNSLRLVLFVYRCSCVTQARFSAPCSEGCQGPLIFLFLPGLPSLSALPVSVSLYCLLVPARARARDLSLSLASFIS